MTPAPIAGAGVARRGLRLFDRRWRHAASPSGLPSLVSGSPTGPSRACMDLPTNGGRTRPLAPSRRGMAGSITPPTAVSASTTCAPRTWGGPSPPIEPHAPQRLAHGRPAIGRAGSAAPTPPNSSAACPRAAGDRAPRKASALSASPMAVSGPPSRAGAWRALFTPRFTPAPWRSHAGASRQRPWPAEPCRSGLAFGSQRLASGPRRRSRSALASRREPKGLRELRLYNRLLSGYVRPQPTLPINHCIDQYCTSRYQATL